MQDNHANRLLRDLNCAGAVVDVSGHIVDTNESFRELFFLRDPSGKTVPGREILKAIEAIRETVHSNTLQEMILAGSAKGLFRLNGYPLENANMDDDLVLVLATSSEDRDKWPENSGRSPGTGLEKLQPEFSSLVGNDPDFRQALIIAQRAAQTDHPILIMGESGTGKEILASTIHKASHRYKEPFVDVNCAAIPDSLVESELFGYEKGAFTGANVSGRQGYFQDAHLGSLFMDEIGDAAPQTQAKLLRVLEDGHFKRVGGNRNIRVDVRLISATNQKLESCIAKGLFRKDLFYRINTITIQLPPLRKRLADLPYLVDHFLALADNGGKLNLQFSETAMDCLRAYPWPGNVRELKGVVDFAVTMTNSSVIEPDSLPGFLGPDEFQQRSGEQTTAVGRDQQPDGDLLEPVMRRVEREHIERVIKQSKSRSEAIRRLGISRRTFYMKIKQYHLE